MTSNRFPLRLLAGRYAVCRLPPDDPWPDWPEGGLCSLTRTAEELSVVCAEEAVPADAKAERGWRAFQLVGPVPFATVGVLSGLTKPLAEAGIGVFVLSTFDTDYLLVKESSLQRATHVLAVAGYVVEAPR